jgi:hypothetical protein
LTEPDDTAAHGAPRGEAPALPDAEASWDGVLPGTSHQANAIPAATTIDGKAAQRRPSATTIDGGAFSKDKGDASEEPPPDDSDYAELLPLSDDEARVGTLVHERYLLTKLLGTGGMGAVYSAEHIHMKKQVALKVLHREMTVLPEVVARFEREAIAAARIEHPNVTQARDFGRLEDGSCYLVLEYVDGETLSHVLAKEGFTIARSLNVILQVAEALGAAHDKQIVHRDLKPDNVMLVRSASDFERVKVLDFGIAKVSIHERGRSQRPLTKMGSVFGTPEYMSPEQAAGQRVDHRADLYSLGLLLYRMIAGSPPFQAENINQVLMMQITQAPPPLPDAVPEPVREFVDKLLQKLPNDRYQSAEEVITRLVEMLETIPEEALGISVAPDPEPSLPELPVRVSGMLARIGATLDQSSLGARVAVGGDSAPIWRLGLVGLVLVLLALGLVSLLGAPDPKATPPKVATQAKPLPSDVPTPNRDLDPGLERMLAHAFAGSEEALLQLEQRPADERSVREWLALGRGRARLQKHLGAVEAYQAALQRDASLGKDPAVQRDVAQALKDGDAVDLALDVAARYLGSAGADMLYHTWVETKEVNAATQNAKKLLQRADVRASASPALLFLLDWREAMSCEDYRQLLPRASVAADTRSVTLLSRLEAKNDCDLPAEAIAAAISAARDRPAPIIR